MCQLALLAQSFQSMHDKLDHLAEMIETRNSSDHNAEWLVIALRFRGTAEKESEAARKLLGVSPKTWQNHGGQCIIPFSQIGRKNYVNRADIDVFLRQHRIGG